MVKALHWKNVVQFSRIATASWTARLAPLLLIEDVRLVEFTYPVFARMPGESYCRRLWSLLIER